MSPNQPDDVTQNTRFPRVSGDEPKQLKNQLLSNWFSPRERG